MFYTAENGAEMSGGGIIVQGKNIREICPEEMSGSPQSVWLSDAS